MNKLLTNKIKDYNATACDYPRETVIHNLFEKQVKKNPNNIALSWEDNSMTYEELNKRAENLASRLISAGTGPGDIIALLCDHSPEMIIAILAVLKTGAAYVPIDKGYPSARIEFIIKDCESKTILTRDKINPEIAFSGEILDLAEEYTAFKDIHLKTFENSKNGNSESLAYIIYTSGSTGKPKGVEITHCNLVNYCIWAQKIYTDKEHYMFPLYSSPSFDLTVTSIFVPLISGNTIRIYNCNHHAFSIHKIINENLVNIIKVTPTHLKLMDKYNLSSSKIKKIIVGGESLPASLCQSITKKFKDKVIIYNEYGPTEATVGCMIHTFDPEKDTNESVPIGKPADNTQIYLLDENFHPVNSKAKGEIYIAGDGIAQGYRNLPDMTNKRFIENPFTHGKRMYRTGDYGAWLPDENLIFLGRIDEQVKIHGYRIETGEIESILRSYKDVKDCFVIAKESNGVAHLMAYYVSTIKINHDDLKKHIAEELPVYMIPSGFIRLETIPVSINGKVEKKMLPDK